MASQTVLQSFWNSFSEFMLIDMLTLFIRDKKKVFPAAKQFYSLPRRFKCIPPRKGNFNSCY